MRVVIAGGGIGGLTAAIALRTVGIEADVYEQAPEFREVGAGIGLAANALRALETLGLAGEIRLQGVQGIQGGLYTPSGEALLSMPVNDGASRAGLVAVVHRAELLALLVRHADAGRLHLGRRCIGVEQDRDGVTARFETGDPVRADAVVAADGLRSVVRAQVFGNPPVRYVGYTAWRAVVNYAGGRDLGIGETWGRGRRFGIVPMAGERVYWFAVKNAAPDEKDPPAGTKKVLGELFRGWHAPIDELIAAAGDGSILRNDIYDIDPLPHLVRERVALLGDAAHAMTPNLGQGACQAIEDAVVLAACLRTAAGVESGLLAYERRRMPRTRQVQRMSRRIGAMAQLENPVLCGLRDFAMRMTPPGAAKRQMESLLSAQILTPAEEALFADQRIR